ncbi:MAG: DUF5777 family beta-barrel protein [Ferruginibacter sp.]
MISRIRLGLTLLLTFVTIAGFSQDDLLASVADKPKKEFVKNAFKSSRVINGHSIEFIGKGVLDTRILHRFGTVENGFSDLFGLDQASMRFGFDYGITDNLTVGIGRSTEKKELDGFIKYRPIQQARGGKGASPVSVVLVSGITCYTIPWSDPTRKNYFSSRLGFYNQLIVGRKFSDAFSMQLAPTHVHLNLVEKATDVNDIFAVGIGARMKMSKRIAFVVDYHLIAKEFEWGDDDNEGDSQLKNYKNPLSIGFDIETGGHVFQLHFSNATGMNEKAFITSTTQTWGKGEIRFGFNLSRVFNIVNY